MYHQAVFFAFLVGNFAECAKILGVFPYPSRSHQAMFQPIWRELSLRGHDVTVITPNPLNDPSLSNLTEIDTSFAYELPMVNNVAIGMSKNSYVFQTINFAFELAMELGQSSFLYKPIQDLIKDNKTYYDLILCQYSHIFSFILGIAGRFKTPVVGISSVEVFLHSHDALGNPTHPVVSPDFMLNFSGNLSFFERVHSLLFNIWYRIFYYWYALPRSDRLSRKLFGSDIPYLGDLERNMSLLLVNVNPLINNIRPNVPNMVEINQIHIREKKPLPKELKDYLDSSSQGLVYFSLGSNVKSVNLSLPVRREIIKAMSELPYNVLWKWEDDCLPDKPKNVMINKWLPQQDILGHPNVKVFVTQAGLQSLEEAITNEVPMLGIPFMSDQPSNVKKMVALGLGLGLDYRTLTKSVLKSAIIEIAENKKYKTQIQKAKSILLDQPMKGVEKAVWWIEYVIRHQGARHLRSPAADLSFFEYFMIDVIMFLCLCVFAGGYSLLKIGMLVKKIRINKTKMKKH